MIKEEAIEILSDMRAEYNIFSDDEEEAMRYRALSWAIRALNERTGRWKVSDLPKGKMKYCSECGFGQYIADERQYNFCPNCGADMRGEQDE